MAVGLRKGKDIKKNIQDLFEELAFDPGKVVYIKPNLSGRDPVLPGENTSVEVLDALIVVLKGCGCKEIIIGHGALLGSEDHTTTFKESIHWSGFDKYFNMEGVRLINIDELERTEVQTELMKLHLPLDFLENDVDSYINLAKIKTHMEATVSFSLKNQMGLPLPLDRAMMHKTNLELMIAKIGLSCRPNLNILEGYPAMDGNGPHHGDAKNLELIAVGDDMVELDSFMCKLLKIDPKKVSHIQNSVKMEIGEMIKRESFEKYSKFIVDDFCPASKVYKFGLRARAYPTYSCSRCINAVNLAGREFKKHPIKYIKVIFAVLFSRKIINIVFGKADGLKYDPKQRYICIGNCAKEFAEKNGLEVLDKCPPGIDEAREHIVDKISENNKK